jgi:DNA (cytosine-5)-methyltransferase 1
VPRRTFVSLFCGCGGFDIGAIRAGFEPVLAVDNDPVAIETHRANIGSLAVLGDLSNPNATELPSDIDLLLGGPPCQGFSSAGPKNADDPRNKLWAAYLRELQACRPKAFVLENVLGFRHELRAFVAALVRATAGRYRVEARKLVAQFYGVPQFRHRLFVIGVRADVGDSPVWPNPVAHATFDYRGSFPGMVSMQEALQDLGPPTIADNRTGDDALDHVCVRLGADDAAIAAHVPNGGSLKDIPDPHLPLPYRERERSIRGWTWYYRKPLPDLTARSVIASIRPIYATILAPDVQYERLRSRWTWTPVSAAEHTSSEGLYTSPVPARRLSVRECARLQTFPDDFRFRGTLLDKHRMIGNAVPCELSRRICLALRGVMDGDTDARSSTGTQMPLLFEGT